MEIIEDIPFYIGATVFWLILFVISIILYHVIIWLYKRIKYPHRIFIPLLCFSMLSSIEQKIECNVIRNKISEYVSEKYILNVEHDGMAIRLSKIEDAMALKLSCEFE